MEPIDPQLYERTDLRAALAAHQLGPVFDALNTETGISYREIGRRTGSHESVIDAQSRIAVDLGDGVADG